SSRPSKRGPRLSAPPVPGGLRSAQAGAHLSGAHTETFARGIDRVEASTAPSTGPTGKVRVLTESAIRDQALDMIGRSEAGEALDIAMFYLSHRPVIKALIAAQQRGVPIRRLLDANRDAFAHGKDGSPNRPVANELTRAGVAIRCGNTHGDQCHSKLISYTRADEQQELLRGSANFTRRNLDDLNLESNVWVAVPSEHPTAQKATDYFNRHWESGPETSPALSLPYSEWADSSRLRYWQYRFMEATGLSTF